MMAATVSFLWGISIGMFLADWARSRKPDLGAQIIDAANEVSRRHALSSRFGVESSWEAELIVGGERMDIRISPVWLKQDQSA